MGKHNYKAGRLGASNASAHALLSEVFGRARTAQTHKRAAGLLRNELCIRGFKGIKEDHSSCRNSILCGVKE